MKPSHVLAAAGLLALAAPTDADACGGCFAPPQTVQVVTDHRMVLALSPDRTTLWDQFRFTGRAEDFSWILPIRNGPGVIIEEADVTFLSALDDVTAALVNPPPAPFGCRTSSGGLSLASSSRGAGAAPESQDPGVRVLSERVVGPYQTATLAATDPTALRTWLRSNGYTVPAAVEPVVDHYVGLRMDFVAVRLRPGADTTQMKPLRITTPGMNPTLPLRMIAAGVADKVGLVLTVIAPSRMEAQNFPNGEVRNADLVYDYDNPTGGAAAFLAVFDRLNRASEGRLWLTESAQSMSREAVDRAMQQRCARMPSTSGTPCFDSRVSPLDAQVAFERFGDQAFVTRLRADLATGLLDRDLQVRASDRGARPRTYDWGTLRNNPCANPRSDFQGCATRPGARGSLCLGLAVAALVAARRRRR